MSGAGMMYDMVLRGGRVVDPGAGRDEVADVAFAGGVVAAVGAGQFRRVPGARHGAQPDADPGLPACGPCGDLRVLQD
ncbi:MAG: hypothetical protein EON55_25495, partial [Alphaproteobacteria bacterium]